MQFFKRAGQVLAASAVGMVVMAQSAHAAIDASVGTAFGAVAADATTLSGTVTPYVVSVLGLGIVLKLIKKFGNKIG
jgi:hypothetical protein